MRRRANVLALVTIVFVAACTRAARAQSRETPWLVVPAVTATDDSQLDATTAAARALEGALTKDGSPVLANAVAAERFEARHPTAISLDAETQKSLLKALTDARRELILGRLEKADAALQSIPGVQSPEQDVLRRSLAQLMSDICVIRAYNLRRDGHSAAAHDAMVRCVVTYPDLKPPVQPEDRELFNSSRAAVPFAELAVRGPSGCTVRLFGIAVGRSPLTLPRVAIGRTPIQLDCTEHAAGRRHMINVEAGANEIEIDPRFDQSVRSRGALRLIYHQHEARQAHLDSDVASLGRMLNARLVLIESDRTNPATYRVTAHGNEVAELGELGYDERAGVNRGDLRRIVGALRGATRERPTPTIERATASMHEGIDPALPAHGATEPRASSLVGPVVGAALGVLGAGGLITSLALYAERQDYRLEARPAISDEVLLGFDARGARMLAIGGTAAAGLVAAEYLLLPRAEGVPAAAWVAGAAGVAGAAVGLAYAVGSDDCEPMAVVAGERTSRACYARTSDGMFGPMLMLSSVPLLNVPLVYLLRGWLGSSGGAVSLTPSGFAVRGSF